MILGLALSLSYNVARFASPLDFGYSDAGFTPSILPAVGGLLFHPNKSVLLFAPIERLYAYPRLAKVPPESVDWRVVHGPCFDNHVGLLELDGRAAVLRVERAVTADDGRPAGLEPLYEHRLAGE